MHRNASRMLALAAMFVLAASVVGQPRRDVGGPCDGCEWSLLAMPGTIAAKARIAPPDEPGEPMTITGTVYGADGRTPAADVVIYAYHTDATGNYPRIADGPAKGIQHGRLRGWVRTGADGRYAFHTIRPAPYPGRGFAAHVHMHAIEPGLSPYYLDDIVFTDDPLVDAQRRSRDGARGGSGVTTPERDVDGTWQVRRDIVLGLDIPDHP